MFERLLETGPVNANELADLMGKDRSTVYRALQKMMTCGMCFRETRSIRAGDTIMCTGRSAGRAEGEAGELRRRLV